MQFHEASNEVQAARAFSHQSRTFDASYNHDLTIQYKRDFVRAHLLEYLNPGDEILELNAGTGEDALFLSRQGFNIHATDISQGMLNEIVRKSGSKGVGELSYELCSYTSLDQLKIKKHFDHIFSNFAGLNCTSELHMVLRQADALLHPGGKMTLVILPRFCLWETALLFVGKWKTAFRRFRSARGSNAKIDDHHFTCYYYNPREIRTFLKEYKTLSIKGLCSFVPPSYMEGFALKYPQVFKKLTSLEKKYSANFPWRSIGDYYIITLQKPLQG